MAQSKKQSPNLRPDDTSRFRYRIRFAKTGLLRWISHRDLARLWDRLCRRVELPLSMTEGFHPKPRIAFPSALALGVESLDEVVEIELCEQLGPADLLARLQSDRQPGLFIHRVALLPEGFGKAQLESTDYVITLVEDTVTPETLTQETLTSEAVTSEVGVVGGTVTDTAGLQASIDAFLSTETVSVERKGKAVSFRVAEQVSRLEVCRGGLYGDGIYLTMLASERASLKPGDVMELLGIGDWIARGATIKRTRVRLEKQYTPAGDPADRIAVCRSTTGQTSPLHS